MAVANLLVSSDHWLADPSWRGEIVSLSFLGLFLFPTLFMEQDSAAADQFLKGETMHLYLVHPHGLPLEELVRHSRVLFQEEGGEEEEAQEGEADNL